ncbi:MAG TPA: phosphate ABC transporter substrate-binding protein [Ktedonobacteraceae bacterium]|nr:phosphate ABC transporter substrate-binding protein [Ktedonobacteraceae bacterium]
MFKRSRIALLIGVAVAITLIISACGGSSTTAGSTPTAGATASTLGTPGSFNCVQGQITASGSTALAPLVKAVATQYEGKCSGATITVNLGGSKTGLANAEAGSSDIGNSDVPANAQTQADLVDHQVAVVIFGIIVNKDVTVTNITTAQLKDIYSGKTTNWNQVGGPNLPIVVVSRPASSGTRATFAKYILGGPETVSGPSHLTTDSTGVVITNVASTSGAIGYAATGPAKANSGVALLSLDGNAPTSDNVKTNTYKFWNIEHMYTKGTPKPLAQALIDYMVSSDAKTIASQQDFIAITDMSADAITAHNAVS